MKSTKNEEWGFHGTMGKDAKTAWPIAMTVITDLLPGADEDAIRVFLDSSHGRHFADVVLNGMFYGAALQDAIQEAAGKWQNLKIGRFDAKDHGIPRGLPYLEAWIIHYGIMEEAARPLPTPR
jgi:hypothetical protein